MDFIKKWMAVIVVNYFKKILIIGALCLNVLLNAAAEFAHLTPAGEGVTSRYLSADKPAAACAGAGKAEESIVPSHTRHLLIFLDDLEKDINEAISSKVCMALQQKACPIILSSSTLNIVINQSDSLKSWFFPHEVTIPGKREFDKGIWIVKEISPDLMLLLPDTYLAACGVSNDEVISEVAALAQPTSTELTLGLKVNHMKNRSMKSFRATSSDKALGTAFIETLKGEIALPEPTEKPRKFSTVAQRAARVKDRLALERHQRSFLFNRCKKSTIFCTNFDYIAHPWVAQPSWVMYMSGHGMIRSSIVGISLDDFRKALDFFEYSLSCTLLMYSSCYAAGTNEKIIYADSINPIQKQYSFALVTDAITDAYTYGQSITACLDTYQNRYNFSGFVAATQGETLDYAEAVGRLMSLTSEDLHSSNNVPQIKLPGVEWFNVLDRSNVIQIGSVLAKSKDPESVLTLEHYFNRTVTAGSGKETERNLIKAILLYCQDIPFEIDLGGLFLDAIISAVPGDTVHTFRRISSTHLIQTVMEKFLQIDGLKSHKIYFIKELKARQAVRDKFTGYPSFSETVLTHVIIDANTATVLYTDSEGEIHHDSGYLSPHSSGSMEKMRFFTCDIVLEPSNPVVETYKAHVAQYEAQLNKAIALSHETREADSPVIDQSSLYATPSYGNIKKQMQHRMNMLIKTHRIMPPLAEEERVTDESETNALAAEWSRHHGERTPAHEGTTAHAPADGESEAPALSGAGYSSTAELNAIRTPLTGS